MKLGEESLGARGPTGEQPPPPSSQLLAPAEMWDQHDESFQMPSKMVT